MDFWLDFASPMVVVMAFFAVLQVVAWVVENINMDALKPRLYRGKALAQQDALVRMMALNILKNQSRR